MGGTGGVRGWGSRTGESADAGGEGRTPETEGAEAVAAAVAVGTKIIPGEQEGFSGERKTAVIDGEAGGKKAKMSNNYGKQYDEEKEKAASSNRPKPGQEKQERWRRARGPGGRVGVNVRRGEVAAGRTKTAAMATAVETSDDGRGRVRTARESGRRTGGAGTRARRGTQNGMQTVACLLDSGAGGVVATGGKDIRGGMIPVIVAPVIAPMEAGRPDVAGGAARTELGQQQQ